MPKKIAVILSSSLVLQAAMPLAAWAAFHEDIQQRRKEAVEQAQEKREQFKQEVEQRRDNLRQETAQVKAEAKRLREEKKAELEKRRQAFEKKKEEIRRDLEARKEKFKAEAERRKEELKKKFGEKRAANIEKFFKKMVEKFEAALKRFKEFADRIEERIKRAEARGRDANEARAKLLTAREKIAEVERTLENAKEKYTEAAKDPDFRVAFGKVRDLVHDVSAKLRDAHRALAEAVAALKGIRNEAESAATTTPQ